MALVRLPLIVSLALHRVGGAAVSRGGSIANGAHPSAIQPMGAGNLVQGRSAEQERRERLKRIQDSLSDLRARLDASQQSIVHARADEGAPVSTATGPSTVSAPVAAAQRP